MCLSKHLLEYGYLSAYLPAYICVFVCVFVCLIIYEFSFCENVHAAVIIVLFTNQRRHTSTTMPESALILTKASHKALRPANQNLGKKTFENQAVVEKDRTREKKR